MLQQCFAVKLNMFRGEDERVTSDLMAEPVSLFCPLQHLYIQGNSN